MNKTRNPKLWLACGQHINASDDKCTDLARHPYTQEQWEFLGKTLALRIRLNEMKEKEPTAYFMMMAWVLRNDGYGEIAKQYREATR